MLKRNGNQKLTNAALQKLTGKNLRLARGIWAVSSIQIAALKALTEEMRLSITAGDLILLEGKWYITHAGLIRLARRNHCVGITVRPVKEFCQPVSSHWVFEAIVYTFEGSKGFVGYGDADPSNISRLVQGAEMRVAETRAVNRALRKAYGIGLCSVEELGWLSESAKPIEPARNPNGFHTPNGSNGNPSRLRDQLCLLIRQYNLDPILVKAYAAHFCGTETLKDASRDLVESFISHISSSAKEDIDGLICKLNSYSRPVEVKQ